MAKLFINQTHMLNKSKNQIAVIEWWNWIIIKA